MSYEIENYQEIIDLFTKCNIDLEKDICFIPENLSKTPKCSDFVYSETTSDLRKVFEEDSVLIEYLTDDKPLLRARKSADWFGPTIFIGFNTLTNNPHLIGVFQSLLSSYLYDFFKGISGGKKVKFEVIIERKKKQEFKKVKYEGTIDGISDLEGLIKSLKK